MTRYNFAYVNPLRYPGDNGRVLGYDNAHGEHHRHFMGRVTAVTFETFVQIDELFQSEWEALVRKTANAKKN